MKKSGILIFVLAALISAFLSIRLYSGDGRIDIYWAQGTPENRIQDIKVKNVAIIRPGWCEQCVVLPLKQVRLYPHKKKIAFKVVGDGKIKIALMGMDHYHSDGKGLIPVYNDYSYLKINGKKVTHGEKSLRKVWHNRPYFKDISVKNGETVSLEVKLKFHPGTADYFILFCCFALMFVLFSSLFLGIKICLLKSKVYKNRDWGKAIISGYQSIDPVYRKSFWIVFLIINIVFGFHTVTFMWGNHDWNTVQSYDAWNKWSYMGRYAGNWIKYILLGGAYLPVVSNVLAFAGLALTAVLLCIYWKAEKKILPFVLCGLVLSIQPYTLEWLYYVNALPDFLIMPALMVTGFILADKSVEIVSIRKKIFLNLIAVAFMNFGLATYPSLLNLLAVVLTGSIMLDVLRQDGETGLNQIIKKKSAAVIDVVLACFLFKAVLICLAYAKILSPSVYTIQSLPLNQIPHRIIECVKAAFSQMYWYKFIFISNTVTMIFALLFILSLICILFSKKELRQKVLALVLFFGALIATKSDSMISNQPHFVEPRIDLFGLVYFQVLILVVLFEAPQAFKNMAVMLSVVVAWISAVNDSYVLRAWKLGFEAEKMMWNRMLYRLETQPEFDANKTYTLIQIGHFSGAREKFIPKIAKKIVAGGMGGHVYDPHWRPFSAHQAFYPVELQIKQKFNSIQFSVLSNDSYRKVMEDLYKNGVLQKAKAWPKENSLIVYKDIILVVADEAALEKILKEIDDKKKEKTKEKTKTKKKKKSK